MPLRSCVHCPQCNAEITQQAKFCYNCGFELSETREHDLKPTTIDQPKEQPATENSTQKPLKSPKQVKARYKSTTFVIYFSGALALLVSVHLTEPPNYAIYKYLILMLSSTLVLGIPAFLVAKFGTKTPIYRAARVFCWLFLALTLSDLALALYLHTSPGGVVVTYLRSLRLRIGDAEKQTPPSNKLSFQDIQPQETQQTPSLADSQKESSIPCDELVGPIQDYIGQQFMALKEPVLLTCADPPRQFALTATKSERSSITLFIKALGDGNCIERETEIVIHFQDEDTLRLNFIGHVGCEDLIMSFFGGIWHKQDELQKLKSKLPNSLHMKYQNSHVKLEFPAEKAEIFRNAFICLSE